MYIVYSPLQFLFRYTFSVYGSVLGPLSCFVDISLLTGQWSATLQNPPILEGVLFLFL